MTRCDRTDAHLSGHRRMPGRHLLCLPLTPADGRDSDDDTWCFISVGYAQGTLCPCLFTLAIGTSHPPVAIGRSACGTCSGIRIPLRDIGHVRLPVFPSGLPPYRSAYIWATWRYAAQVARSRVLYRRNVGMHVPKKNGRSGTNGRNNLSGLPEQVNALRVERDRPGMLRNCATWHLFS